jgi:hypothetical protein
MALITVSGRDDDEMEDAFRRGVAEGLARMLGVPAHPKSGQALLEESAHHDEGSVRKPPQIEASLA